MAITRRRLYVNNADTILASAPLTAQLKAWATAKSIDTFQWYDLYTILTNGPLTTALAAFITDCRNTSAIQNHIAVMSNTPLSTTPPVGNTLINTYNTAHPGLASFNNGANDGLNLEYEWWLGIYTAAQQRIRHKDWATAAGIYSGWAKAQSPTRAHEAYMGQFNPAGDEMGEAKNVIGSLSKLLLSVYVPAANYNVMINYALTRLDWVGQANKQINGGAAPAFPVVPIFSIEPAFFFNIADVNQGNKTFDQIMIDYQTQYAATPYNADAFVTSPTEYTIFSYSWALQARPSTSTP